jgi:hypothetical protein
VGRFSLSSQKHELAVGQMRRQVVLGTEAVYRVCSCSDELIEVEVVRAPGLQPGDRFNVTRDAAQDMDLILDRV